MYLWRLYTRYFHWLTIISLKSSQLDTTSTNQKIEETKLFYFSFYGTFRVTMRTHLFEKTFYSIHYKSQKKFSHLDGDNCLRGNNLDIRKSIMALFLPIASRTLDAVHYTFLIPITQWRRIYEISCGKNGVPCIVYGVANSLVFQQ